MAAAAHPLFEALRRRAASGALVVAHRGDSDAWPENTLPAFRSARSLGVDLQEFDVRSTRDGVLVCMHDAGLDRTTDAAARLGPGALVAQTTQAELRRLDAGSWHDSRCATAVPTLGEALAVVLPSAVPLIEHKDGAAARYIDELARLGVLPQCILQSFDWAFVAAAKRLAPELAVAVLGPVRTHARPDDDAVDRARALGAGMLHWQASRLTHGDVARAHAAGLLVCTYTTDDEAGLCGGAAIGFDAMCTNVPARMLQLRRSGLLARRA